MEIDPNIVALFRDLRAQFPTLMMTLALDDPSVDLRMDAPKQPGLAFHVNLTLQGDELHLSAGAFTLEWFPCTDPDVVAGYRRAVRGLLSGTYRIVEYCIRERVVKAQLQRPVDGGWQTIGTWTNWGALVPWPRNTRILQNGALE